MTGVHPRRSVLYLPGSNARAIEKARTLMADALILDLEDAVAPDAKETARAAVSAAVKAGFGRREVAVRINALASPWGEADLAAAAAAGPDAILIPKVSSPADLKAVEAKLGDAEVALWAMVETPRAILDIAVLASAGGRLACFVMGTNDLVKEMGGRHTPDRFNLMAALSLTVMAARANGLGAIDGVTNDIDDDEGFTAQCEQARSMGFDGKTVIHPRQIAPANAAFAPSAEEIAAATRIIAAFDSPENQDKGAIRLDGRMVERLHAEAARKTLALAESIRMLDASSGPHCKA